MTEGKWREHGSQMLRCHPTVRVVDLPTPSFATTTTTASLSPGTSAKVAGGTGRRAAPSGTSPSAADAGKTGGASPYGYLPALLLHRLTLLLPATLLGVDCRVVLC